MIQLIWVLVGICLLVVLNLKFKMHNMLSLLLVGLFIALTAGIPIDKIITAVETGVGGIFGKLAIIILFGAIIGKIMTDTGASQRIADTVIEKCGTRFLPVGLMFIGVIFGIAMFYEVAFLISVPLVLAVAKKAKVPYMKLVIPIVTGCTMGHSLFPPQPGPVALVAAFDADISKVYIYGILAIIPALLCAGLLLPKFLPGIKSIPLNSMLKPAPTMPEDQLPSFASSISIPLTPAVVMIASSVVKEFFDEKSTVYKVFGFIGSAEISMLLALFAAFFLLMRSRGQTIADLTGKMEEAIGQVGNVLIVICSGGIIKEVIIESGAADHIVQLVSAIPVSPFIIAWIITAIIRVLTGQGAVAAITAAGMVAPLVTQFGLDPALMVICVACGSNTITLMYDGGFLLFKETFGISMKDTFKTWGLLELINSVVGLLAVLVIDLFV
ncbi:MULTISPECIES: gluconate:H+ symporter [Bifidobacterium]|uniref:Fructuronate transporter GntP n=1 Tax=Bifidobacterium tissieri TaxID=1630162 RepID=A0A261FIT1_9BIFI|nr:MULTISPECIES: gluconate:H+ symporter [Bifidobacterium]KAA8827901.1 gluconate permease [Bifidobacterium tissieri]KAA8830875.1 gluconate permease [Bifidobacterium tissieri]OZG59070.1 Fructuronate transporter GntP [Bifidobacterium tissieri]TPF96370.1 gluconate permease [Bifidobacterium sp. UTCIF-39]